MTYLRHHLSYLCLYVSLSKSVLELNPRQRYRATLSISNRWTHVRTQVETTTH